MSTQWMYIIFSVVTFIAVLLDFGLISKQNKVFTMKSALIQSIFWVLLSLGFGVFIWYEYSHPAAIQYLSAYLLEKSLSIDNIFVFIIIFTYFRVKQVNYSRVLLMGILMAIVFRILFIAIGSELVARFSWIMYIFGAFLLYTGFKLFSADEEKEFDPEASWAFKAMKRLFRTTNEEPHGKFIIKKDGKKYLTKLAMVVFMLGLIDIVFAIDSIPAVFSIIPDPNDKLLIYSSNIFAVLGLRSLFFLLQGAADRFSYLQQGIAIVLVYIGVKMLIIKWVHIPVWISLLVIMVCISGSICISVRKNRREEKLSVNSES